MKRRLLMLITALLMLAVACGSNSSTVDTGGETGEVTTTSISTPGSPQDRLDQARARWAEQEANYRLTVRQLCFCPETIWVDTVVGGQIVSHEPSSSESLFDPGERTMDALFDEVQSAIDGGYARLELEFDPETGALIRYWVDVSEQMADEEHGVEVEVGPVTDEPIEIDAAALTDSYGCGYLFAAGNADQTLRLVVGWSAGDAPDLRSPVTFPSDRWTSTLDIGTDLFSNWCDDVMEANEPVPAVTESWEVVSGEMTISPTDADVNCRGATVSATLADVVVETPAGERVELGQLDLVNEFFGCFAG